MKGNKMIEEIYGCEPHGTSENPSPVGGTVLVQYEKDCGDVGIGITLNRAGLERWLKDNPEPEGLGNAAHPDNGLSFYVRLERPAVNRLVRLMRKARDITFGPDA